MDNSKTIISIRGLSKSFGDLRVLNDINLDINEGDIYGLIGRSGAGKSTLLRCINGLEPYQAGSLKVRGKEVSTMTEEELNEARRDMGMIFQNFSLIGRRTIFDNIALPMKLWKYDKAEIRQRVLEIADIVEISDKLDSYPKQLSGGQQQRAGIARALALQPGILLSDEATSALDPSTTNAILDLLKKINRQLKVTIIVVTHQIEVVKRICNKVAILQDGYMALDGDTQRIFMDEAKPLLDLTANELPYIKKPGHALLKISFTDYNHDSNYFLYDLISKTGVPVGVEYSQIEEISGRKTAILFLEVPEAKVEVITRYLKEVNIEWCEVYE